MNDLKALALAATPGPWTHHGRVISDAANAVAMVNLALTKKRAEDDAAYIAAAHPQAVLALLARIEQAEAEVRTLRNAIANEGERIERLEAALRAADAVRYTLDGPPGKGSVYQCVRDYDAARALCNADTP